MLNFVSDWEITGGSGANVSIGTPIAKVSFEAGIAQVPLFNNRTQAGLNLEGKVVGASYGTNFPTLGPVSVSGSLAEFPADGIGKIIKGFATQKRNLVESDFVGTGIILSAAAGSHVGGSMSLILWLKKTPQQCKELFRGCSRENQIRTIISTAKRTAGLSFASTSPAAAVTYLTSQTACVGLCTGMEMSTDILHASVTMQYFLFSKQN